MPKIKDVLKKAATTGLGVSGKGLTGAATKPMQVTTAIKPLESVTRPMLGALPATTNISGAKLGRGLL